MPPDCQKPEIHEEDYIISETDRKLLCRNWNCLSKYYRLFLHPPGWFFRWLTSFIGRECHGILTYFKLTGQKYKLLIGFVILMKFSSILLKFSVLFLWFLLTSSSGIFFYLCMAFSYAKLGLLLSIPMHTRNLSVNTRVPTKSSVQFVYWTKV